MSERQVSATICSTCRRRTWRPVGTICQRCHTRNQMKEKGLHCCIGDLPDGAYGVAITDCTEDLEGELWVGNGEYASQVCFCPYCGFEAKTKPEVK